MKALNYFLLVIFFLGTGLLFPQTFEYISPKDNSNLVSLSTNIILKSSEYIEQSSLSQNEFIVKGSLSGNHTGVVKLSDDNKTILFLPSVKFAPNEVINVTVNPGIKTINGTEFSKISFQFHTTPLSQPINENTLSYKNEEQIGNNQNYTIPKNKSLSSVSTVNSLPSDFPQVTVDTSNNPAPGDLFIANQSQKTNASIGNYIMIFSNNGSAVKYLALPKSANLFKMEPNGDLSYNLKGSGQRIILDTSFTPIDTLQCGNGYNTNGHDCLLLPNGHAVLFANDPEPVDMSQVVPDGNPDAIVTGVVVQELDASKNVVFQWRSWDYLPITASYFDLASLNVDLIHANALAIDNDGNILVSMRHLSSIVKINRQTGNIMWVLGGKLNDFTFINEHAENAPTYFSYQHDVSVLPNGDITLFDNGNQHSPNYSRGVEYKLDEQNKTATLVWEYRHTPDIYAFAMGSVERLPNGNTIIGWGIASATNGIPTFTEVHPDNSIALEFSLPAGEFSYRSYKYPWVSQQSEALVTQEILQGNSYSFNNSNDSTGVKITFNQLNSFLYAFATVIRYNYAPVNSEFTTTAPNMYSNYFKIQGSGINSYTGDVVVNLKYYPAITNPKETVVYARSDSNNTFTALATSYDSAKDELTFTTSILGDFAFGVPQTIDSAYAPVPITPKDSEIVNGLASVKLVWGTRGIVQTYHLQVSTVASFSSLEVDNSNLNSTSYTISSVTNNTTYYWRVNNTNAAGTSDWSKVERFMTSSPYLKVLYPNGGEKLNNDSTYVIRWQSNISDSVNVDLVKDNTVVSVIGDSIISGTNAISWQVPSTIQMDSTYRISVTSIN